MQFSKSGSWLLIILAFSLPMVAFTHIIGDGFVTEHGSMSPAVLSWGSEGNAHFYVSTLTTVIELLVQLPRSCPCSREGCVRSGASRAVILSLSQVLTKLCLEHVSSVDSPDKKSVDVLERAQ